MSTVMGFLISLTLTVADIILMVSQCTKFPCGVF